MNTSWRALPIRHYPPMQAKVMALAAAASVLRKKRKGEAKLATEKREQCLAELRGLLSDFRAVAKMAPFEDP
ncbi:MAG: hypothetical protein AAFQ40_01940 [Cyanobacteria bacterium J06623_5]